MDRSKKANKNEIVEEHEEHEENEDTGVEAEQDEAQGTSTEPYDPTKIRIDPKAYTLRQIIDMIDSKDLVFAPDFQRKRIWNIRDKSRLIESILLRIPLPAFYFSADPDGRLSVVDGFQRLSTIHDFVRGGVDNKGAFALKGLEYFADRVAEQRFEDLDANWKRRIQQTQISVNVIDPQTPNRAKFDIFKRLNMVATPQNSQEIRHCISQQRSREFLKACTGGYRYFGKNLEELLFDAYKAGGGVLATDVYEAANSAGKAFVQVTRWALWNHVKMADRETILRFCAFRLIYDDLSAYAASRSMDDFLAATTEKIDNEREIPDHILLKLATDLERGATNAFKLFGEHAFRKWRFRFNNKNPINRALFETWATVLADYVWDDLVQHKDKIVIAMREKMTSDDKYVDAISSGTGDPAKVKLRFAVARKIIEEAKS